MTSMTLCAPCLFGLESVLSGEIRRLGGENVETTDGRVTFTGDAAMMIKASIGLRTAERICIVLGTFPARSFSELFDNVAELPFEDFIGKSDAFPVKGWSLRSGLYSIPDCQSIIKKAAVTRLGKKYNQAWFEETGPIHQIRFTIHKDIVTIMLDCSGDGLHKRGYRQNSTIAPIKETLAAGIVDLAHIRGRETVYDPMCGSGTLIIESALRGLKVAPGLNRRFAAERWGVFDKSLWRQERENAVAAVDKAAPFRAYGYDIDAMAVGLSKENAVKAKIGGRVETSIQDISKFKPDADNAVVLCNPPYGERMLDVKEAEKLYKTMGQVMPPRKGTSYYIITPHKEFEKFFGRRADKKRKLYNGMIECQLYMYFK